MRQCLYGRCSAVECGENQCGYFRAAPQSEPDRGPSLEKKPAMLTCSGCRHWENDMCDRKDATCGICTNAATIGQLEVDMPVGLRTLRHFGCVNAEPIDDKLEDARS